MPRRRGAPLAGARVWALTCVLVAFAPPGVAGFSLPGASSPTPTPTPTAEWTFAAQRRGRRAAEAAVDDSRCATSCDETPNSNCDAQDANGDYKLGCDMHYTTHCDDFSACASPPAPPARPPWQGDGTYPHPPPHPPPPSPPARPLETAIGLTVLVVLLILLCACCACVARDGPGSPAALCCAKNCACFTWCLFPHVDRSHVTRVRRADADAGAAGPAPPAPPAEQQQGATEVKYAVESDETLRAMAKARLPLMAMPLSASLAGK